MRRPGGDMLIGKASVPHGALPPLRIAFGVPATVQG
jgi:hypothetical protein